MESIDVLAPAKVNLYLKVIRRRPDGYHELATLMQKVGLYDEIHLEKIPAGITLRCPGSDLPENGENLVVRAARFFLDRFEDRISEPSGLRIVLKKNIPVAAGLGGGSSDAASVLIGLRKLLDVDCTLDELLELGSRLGADVPLFISPVPAAWATGIGDQLQAAVAISDYFVLLVNPGFSVSTQWVYKNFRLTDNKQDDIINDSASSRVTVSGCDFLSRAILPAELYNDLELVTLARHKELRSLKKRLVQLGAACAMMSGSGPTIFGLFSRENEKGAKECLAQLRGDYGKVYLVDPLSVYRE
ncbi:MAG: 4-(cytidine 5'-diphospho)-2-C-methyl-D-erythritol kinase [Desulfobulbaceae bacterium]|nr:4-(cytidine 5'-diphospho)-2-C-methyl-D-erythritol kinase [Desulfobulbaceae bacterium]